MTLHAVVAADVWFEYLMLSVRTPSLTRAFEVITFFGEPTTIIGLAGLVGLALLSSSRGRSFIAGFVIALAGGGASGLALKYIVQRARPGGLLPAIAETGYSFPSGHAVGSMVFYGFIAFMLCRLYPRYAKVVVATATLVILIIGFSRLYLGVHFPSDVVAGYLLGGAWLLVGMRVVGRQASRLPD